MGTSRFAILLLACLTCLPTLAVADGVTKVQIDPIPLLTEVELGKGPVEQTVMMRLQSPEVVAQNKTEVAQDLIVVLDVSGSMRGGKLDKAKAAIAAMVTSLRPNDRLHLVTYHRTARVEFTRGTSEIRDELLAKIQAMTPQSTTNLYAGLQEADSILGSGSDLIKNSFGGKAVESDSVKRIFLFSDGLVNAGVTDHQSILRKVEALRGQGVTTSAFGIGEDFDETLMSAISEAGHGDFFFIRGQEDMEKVVRVATAGFRNLFATEASLRLTPLGSAKSLFVYGPSSDHHYQVEGDTEVVDVTVGDLHSGDARTILLDLKLPQLSEAAEYLDYELSYIPVGSGDRVKQQGHASISVAQEGHTPAEPNTAVLQFRSLQLRLMREEDIEKEVESGHFSRAAALEDELELDLRKMSQSACSGPQGSFEQSEACSRTTAAWKRTQRSVKSFRSGDIGIGNHKIARMAYSNKRMMNSKVSMRAYDEL